MQLINPERDTNQNPLGDFLTLCKGFQPEESESLRLGALLKLQQPSLHHACLSFLSHPSLEQRAYKIV